MRAVQNVIDEKDVVLNSAVAVVDASKCKMYIKNFGEFFINQIAHAGTIILSRTGNVSEEKLNTCIALIREHNDKATIVTTPWDELDGKDILDTIEGAKDLEAELLKEIMEQHEHDEEEEHHHHHCLLYTSTILPTIPPMQSFLPVMTPLFSDFRMTIRC